MKNYNVDIQYDTEKTNVAVDVLSRKTIHSSTMITNNKTSFWLGRSTYSNDGW